MLSFPSFQSYIDILENEEDEDAEIDQKKIEALFYQIDQLNHKSIKRKAESLRIAGNDEQFSTNSEFLDQILTEDMMVKIDQYLIKIDTTEQIVYALKDIEENKKDVEQFLKGKITDKALVFDTRQEVIFELISIEDGTYINARSNCSYAERKSDNESAVFENVIPLSQGQLADLVVRSSVRYQTFGVYFQLRARGMTRARFNSQSQTYATNIIIEFEWKYRRRRCPLSPDRERSGSRSAITNVISNEFSIEPFQSLRALNRYTITNKAYGQNHANPNDFPPSQFYEGPEVSISSGY
ncbi:MAG: hypothetical protein LAT68_16625 [Cyclobacteriaceae bacterium]|nr:hypothetical protein [Cyclobacteriaceae bacterium]MCH8517927.1 hypothetical protein [Cyclobacteriaceae bacterium]